MNSPAKDNEAPLPGKSVSLATHESEDEPRPLTRTWIALTAMWLFNFTGILALNGPPTVLSTIGQDLHNPSNQTWVSNALSLVQAVICPLICSISDVFQARKYILIICAGISFIGSAIAPNVNTIYGVIGAQIMIGFGFACIPLVLSVPSEIVPRRWRPQTLAVMNVAASMGATVGPLAIGALTRANTETGWRNFYWIQMGLWGITCLGVIVGYQPPRRHTHLDHLTLFQKLTRIDLIGAFIMTAGLTMLLAALSLGGVTYSWSSAQVLVPLILGFVVSGGFGVYEWKGTSTGILHHDLIRLASPYQQTLILGLCLILVEGAVLFAYVIYYPVLTTSLFETDPLLVGVRLIPFWLASAVSTMLFGYASTRYRTIKYPLVLGYIIYTAGMVGFATIQPDQNANAIAFAVVSGFGFGGPLVLVFSGIQLSVPHTLLATATALTTSTRAIGASVFTAIYTAVFSSRLDTLIPEYVSEAAIAAGLPPSEVGSFIAALTNENSLASKTELAQLAGVNSTITKSGADALQQAYADGLRDVFIIAAAIGAVGVIMSFFIGDVKSTMNCHIDATVERAGSVHLTSEKAVVEKVENSMSTDEKYNTVTP